MASRFATSNGLIKAYVETLERRIEKETKALSDGRAVDYVDYKSRVASIKAWNTALDDLGDAVKTYLEEDTDD